MMAQVEEENMALESMRMLNREQGMDEEEALALEQELYGGGVSESEILSENSVQADSVADMTADTMTNPSPVQNVSPTEPERQSDVQYSNFFARLINGVSQMVGPETELGAKLNEFANELEGKDATSEQFKDSVNEYGYHDFNELSEADLADKPEGVVSSNTGEKSDVQDDTVGFVPKGEDPESDFESKMKTDDGVDLGYGSLGLKESQLRTDITEKNDKVMSDFAREGVLSEGFLKAGEEHADMSAMNDMISDMRKELDQDTFDQMVGIDAYDDGSPQKQHCADTHMGMMRGLKTYNDTAKECIEQTYADDPEKKEQAINGLKRTMQNLVPTAWDTCYDNNKRYGFLSESDKKELESMEFVGFQVDYADYEEYMDDKAIKRDFEHSKELSEKSEQDMYANAGLDDQLEADKPYDEPDKSSKSDKSEDKALDKGAGKSEKSHRDRGAQAESLFGDQLKKFAQQENSMSISL